MFDAFSSKYCHFPDYVSNMSLMAQLTGLKCRNNFVSGNGNSDTGACYLSWHNP